MKKFLVLGFAALMSVGAGLSLNKNVNREKEELNAHIIVQLDSPLSMKSSETLLSEQRSIISRIHNEVTYDYDIESHYTNVLNAFAMKVNASHVSQIRNLPGVKEVQYDNYREVSVADGSVPSREPVEPTEVFANISKETMNIPDGTNEGEGTLIAILDSSFMVHATSQTKDPLVEGLNDATHTAFTALEDGLNLKYKDQNAIKSVIDAAGNSFHGKYDATHSTYLNNKVPFYYDYGGDVTLADPEDDRDVGEEDYDVFTEGSDHGNHVASIAAGNDPLYKGIAPKAQLALMKVFTATTYYQDTQDEDGNVKKQKVVSVGAYDSAILKALEDCAILKVDVLNMSLGSALNEFNDDSLAQEAIANLKTKGIVSSISAGNEGKETFYSSAYEYWTTDMVETGIQGSYALNEAAMVIGAGEPDKNYYQTALIVNNSVIAYSDQVKNTSTLSYKVERELTDLLTQFPEKEGVFEYIRIGGLGEAKDFNEVDNDEVGNLVEGKIAVIDRGETSFKSKIEGAIYHKAIAVAIINNDPAATDFNIRMDMGGYSPSVPVVMLLYRDRAKFGKAGDIAECELIQDAIKNNPSARQLASYTSDGPTYDLRIKPDITTPGSNVYGAVYNGESNCSYDYYSGTSMAAPNYAGVYALMLSENLNDATYKNLLEDRLMSTAKPMLDKYSTSTDNPDFDSVRKQGAGLVDVDAALKTKVLLDGSANPNELRGRAKIELKNNDQIKNGNIDLKFTTISELSSAVTYNASLYVYRPATGQLDPERYGEKFTDLDLIANYDELIEKKDFQLTVNAGSNTAEVTYSLSSSVKAELDKTFPYGTYIEGFLVLNAEGQEEISLPYLGFYGDYSEAIPVEPFKFERDNSKVYPSDLLNSIGDKWAGKSGVDYGSDWVMGNWDNMKDLSMLDYLYNDIYLRDIVDSSRNKVVPVGTNPYTGEIDSQEIYMGNNGSANTMIVAQYVMRSVWDNTITITNKATGEVILTDHMFDSLRGALENEDGEDYQWPLYKSHLDIDWYSSGILAHRAYTIIPLYNYEYNEDTEEYTNGDLYPDGEYEVKFSYDLHAGGTYVKSYTLHIDSSAPKVKSVERIDKDGVEYIRVRYEELKFSYVTIDSVRNSIQKDEEGYYIDLKASEHTGKVFLKGVDYSFGAGCSLLHGDDPVLATLSSSKFTFAYDFEETLKEDGTNAFEVSFSYTKSKKIINFVETIDFAFNVSKYLKAGATVKVYAIINGEKKLIDSEFDGTTVTFSGFSDISYYIDCSAKPKKESKGGCGGSVAASSAVISIVSALGICLLSFRKRKEEK